MTNKPPDKKTAKAKPDLKMSGADRQPVGGARPGKGGPGPASDADKGGEVEAPPENSLGVRIVAFCMALMCLCVGNYFVVTHPLMGFAYIVALVTGSYMSYVNRDAKTSWQTKVVIGGIVVVAYNCWLELSSGVQNGDMTAFTPGIHFLAGTYVMQSFELRTRPEINTSTLLGLIILLLIAPIGKSIIFGGAIFVYICLFVALLYFDCVSRTREGWEKQPLQEVSLSSAHEKRNPLFQGNMVLCLTIFPIISAFLFLILPRANDLVDNTYAYICSIYGQKSKDPVMVPDTLPQNAKRWEAPARKKKQSNSVLAGEQPKNKVKSSGDKGDDGREEGDKLEKNHPAKGKGPGETAKTKDIPPAKDPQKKSAPRIKAKPVKGSTGTASAAGGGGEKSDTLSYDDELDVSADASMSNNVLFKIRSNRTCYMKMYGFDKYDEAGKWTTTTTEATQLDKAGGSSIALNKVKSLSVPTNFPALQLNQDYVIEHDMSRNLPVAWIPSTLDWKASDVIVDEFGAIRLADDKELKKGNKYSAVSTFPIYDLQQMRGEAEPDPSTADDLRFRLSRYLQLPQAFPDEVVTLAYDAIATAPATGGNWFNKAEMVTTFLRKNYRYSYTKNHGESTDPLLTFLSEDQEKKGDCKDFATALVMMLRSIGVPSRIVCGFSPGDLNSVSGYREVKFKNAHCWAEVYIPAHGWVPFDATPNGYMPDKPHEQSYDLDSLKKTSKQDLEQLQAPQKQAEPAKPKITWEQVVMILSGVLVAGTCLFFLVRTILRAVAKAKKDKPGNHPAKKYLKQVEADLKKWKVVRLPHETGLEFSRRVKLAAREKSRLGQNVDKDMHQVVESFMDHYEAAFYGNKERLLDLEKLAKRIHEAVAKGGTGSAGGGGGSAGGGSGKEVAAAGSQRASRPAKPGK